MVLIGRISKQPSPPSLEAMPHYSWLGNIRELQNVIERAVILAHSEVQRLDTGMPMSNPPMLMASIPLTGGDLDRKFQNRITLRETGGKVYGPDGAAARLGVPVSTLESRIRALKLNKHQFK